MRKWLALFTLAGALQGAVKLPSLISDHMVLQQGMPVRIWGTAAPGEAVSVSFQGQTAKAAARADGKWEAWLKPLSAAGPLEMTINDVTIHDVLVGEVWIGSGQSNMEFVLANANNHDEEIAQAGHPLIHLFHVKKVVSEKPLDDVEAKWDVCDPKSVARFSAVEYFFGRHLHQALHMPMGLIESDWGGTPAQSWTSHPTLEGDPALKFILDDWERVLERYPNSKQQYDQRLETWNQAVAKAKTEGKQPPMRPPAPQGPGHPNTPAGLYNGMIAPLTPYAIRGVIWYQGESNASEAHAFRYRRLFADMIEDWRDHWGEGDFPFLFVQLANFHSNQWWPVLRESQTETLRLRNTGMALAIDIGESNDIHPKNKQDVGKRLALAALHVAYGKAIEYSGPMFQQAVPEGDAVRVYFAHAEGMQAKGGGAVRVGGRSGVQPGESGRSSGGAVPVRPGKLEPTSRNDAKKSAIL